MRKLISLIIILFVLWGGYWFIGSTALETGLKDYLSKEHTANDPIHIAYSDLTVLGFPNRFDTRLSDISVTDKIGHISWHAPFFQIHALSYKPYHIIAALPHSQTLQLPDQALQITSDEIKGSVVFDAGSLLEKALEIDHSSIVIRNLGVNSDMGWKTTINDGSIATRQTPTEPLHYDLAASANVITLPAPLRAVIDPKQQQPAALKRATLDSTLTFTHPWDLLATRAKTPQLTKVAVKGLTILWGDVQLQASGSLQIDPRGYPKGTLDLVATNWQEMYQLAENANAVDPDFAQTIQNALRVLAGMSDGENVIKAPLNFADGQMLLGPWPIGPAPRLN